MTNILLESPWNNKALETVSQKEESKLVRDFTEESMRPTAGEGFEAVCGAWLVEGRTPMSTR